VFETHDREGLKIVVDEHGNVATVAHWGTVKKAEASLATLRYCRNCVDCRHCGACYNCTRCKNCARCIGCTACDNCRSCSNIAGRSLVADQHEPPVETVARAY